jgi:hypothetical protein
MISEYFRTELQEVGFNLGLGLVNLILLLIIILTVIAFIFRWMWNDLFKISIKINLLESYFLIIVVLVIKNFLFPIKENNII